MQVDINGKEVWLETEKMDEEWMHTSLYSIFNASKAQNIKKKDCLPVSLTITNIDSNINRPEKFIEDTYNQFEAQHEDEPMSKDKDSERSSEKTEFLLEI